MTREREPRPEQIPPYHRVVNEYDKLIRQYQGQPSLALIDRIVDQQIKLAEEFAKPGKFELGRILASQRANMAMTERAHVPYEFLIRHKHGDWGEVGDDDWKANDRAIAESTRIYSAYATRSDKTLWVITEWDRSVTTIVLPGEY